MKLTTLTAILLMSLFAVSASLAGDSTYLEERSARLHQGIAETSQTQQPGMMDTDRTQRADEQERWWK